MEEKFNAYPLAQDRSSIGREEGRAHRRGRAEKRGRWRGGGPKGGEERTVERRRAEGGGEQRV